MLQTLHRIVLWFLVLMAPVTLINWAWISNRQSLWQPSGWLEVSLSYLGLTWFCTLVYFVAAFVARGSFRRSLMVRLSGLSDRDERETQVSNRSTISQRPMA